MSRQEPFPRRQPYHALVVLLLVVVAAGMAFAAVHPHRRTWRAPRCSYVLADGRQCGNRTLSGSRCWMHGEAVLAARGRR